MSMNELGRVGALVAVACGVALACGGGDDDSSGGTSGGAGKGGASMMGAGGSAAGAGNSGGAGGGNAGKGGAAVGAGAGGQAQAGTSTGGGASGASGGTGGASAGSTTSGAGGASGVSGSANGGASGTTGVSGSANGGASGTSACATDTCPFETGVESACKLRFMYGVNYAWQNFAADFGGGSNGITANKNTIQTELQTMAQNGVNVVRWWVWPNFSGGGVTFDGNGTPTGLGGTTVTDLETVLTLAEENDIYLMLTLFSFDNFKTAINPANQNMATLGVDATKRAALVTNVVRPFARAAAQSPHGNRLIAWDVINEPEWAVNGASLYGGDEAFDSDDTCTAVTHTQMETFLKDVITGLRAESPALVTIGAAAMKWRHAWTKLDQDFYQFHIYDWVQMYWPYDQSPTDFGMDDKPMVMGEFPPTGLSGGISYRTLLDSWYQNGYAGALTWRDSTFKVTWSDIKSFADAHPCETSY
jgi:hypothetical protein